MKRFTYNPKWIGFLIFILIVISLLTWFTTRDQLPQTIRIATGSKGGQYYRFLSLLKPYFESKTGHPVIVHVT